MKKVIPLTNEEWKIHRWQKKKKYYICKEEFSTNDDDAKVKNYCHYTGKYRGTTDNIYNLRYKISKEIPVVFHNGSI